MASTVTSTKSDRLADVIRELGDVPLDLILWTPRPGTATESDLVQITERGEHGRIELVDGILVEKPMGARDGYWAVVLIELFGPYRRAHNPGVFGAPDAQMRLREGLIRIPDLHFTSWANLPSDSAHMLPVVDYPPDLAVEILSRSNRPGMISRKRREYFSAGTQLIWVIDPDARTVSVYADSANPDAHVTLTEADTLAGDPVLPGFALKLADYFNDPQLNPRPKQPE